ncbi:MAG: S-methyl-5'-thioinosine phosphorylase [Nitrososphaeria archaeon]
MRSKYAIIAGTGMGKIFELSEKHEVETPYGFAELYSVKGFQNILFLPRHGIGYSLPPHKINYRANIYSLKKLGVNFAIATNAVGSLNRKLSPGSFVVPDQIIDFTKSRKSTFFEGEDGNVVFTDVTFPYSEKVRSALLEASKRLQIKVYPRGTYVCTEGPRYETAAEIRAYKILGADIVGMTGVPEAFLAREAGVEYASISVVTNYAAGIAKQISHGLVMDIMYKAQESVRKLIFEAINVLEEGLK